MSKAIWVFRRTALVLSRSGAGGTSGRLPRKSSRSPTARSLGTGQALSTARSTEAWPTTTGAAWPISGASLVGQAARTPQGTAPSARGLVPNRGPPDGGPACGRALGNKAECQLQEDGGWGADCRWPCPGPAPKDWRRPWNQGLSSGAAGLRPARFSRQRRNVGLGALWGRLAALARPTGRPSLLFGVILSAT